MKNILDVKQIYRKKPNKPKVDRKRFKKKPTPIKQSDPFNGICRILPMFVADNFDEFLTLSPPQYIKNKDAYVLRIKQKISCLKTDNKI